MAKARRVTKLHAGDQLDRAASRILKARVKDVVDWSAAVDKSNDPVELHNLRIATKRLRYTLELVQTILPPDAVETALDAVQELQELAGQIHDDDVLMDKLRARCAEVATEEALTLADGVRTPPGQHHAHTSDTSDLGALPTRVHGLLSILSVVSRRRDERYTALVEWWHQHPDLLAELRALSSRKVVQAT